MSKKAFLLVAAAVLAADQATKALLHNADAVAVPGLLALYGTRNTGAAFSLLSNIPHAVAALSLALFLALVILGLGLRHDRLLALGVALAAGGAAGNLLDRIRLGYVVDFLRLLFVDFPIFNAADIAITLGAFLASAAVLLRKESKDA